MQHLLKIEWLKLSRYRAFFILLGLLILSILGVNYIVHLFINEAGNISMLVGTPFQFPTVWNTVAHLSSYVLPIPGLIMILIISNEFSFRTHRQNIIDGLSRTQFISAKIGLGVIFSICLTVMVFVLACLFGLAEGGSSFSFSGIKYIFYFFLQSLLYISVAMVFTLIFKRSGLSIGVFLLYAFILEDAISALINHNVIQSVGYFFPLESSDKLVLMPIAMAKNIAPNVPDEIYLLVAVCVWITACLWFCKKRFEKIDL